MKNLRRSDAVDAVDADTIEAPHIISDDSPPRWNSHDPLLFSFPPFFPLSLFLYVSLLYFLFAKVVGGLYTRNSDIRSVAICVQSPVFIHKRLFYASAAKFSPHGFISSMLPLLPILLQLLFVPPIVLYALLCLEILSLISKKKKKFNYMKLIQRELQPAQPEWFITSSNRHI